ncbi:hypothetical protein B5F91_08115 [Bacteroides sp. An322]|nr:hypothetical protein B5F91_08115 [Bacteroides sp. An322]
MYFANYLYANRFSSVCVAHFIRMCCPFHPYVLPISSVCVALVSRMKKESRRLTCITQVCRRHKVI